MIELIWDKGFKLTYKKWERKHPELRDQFVDKIKLFISDPFHFRDTKRIFKEHPF